MGGRKRREAARGEEEGTAQRGSREKQEEEGARREKGEEEKREWEEAHQMDLVTPGKGERGGRKGVTHETGDGCSGPLCCKRYRPDQHITAQLRYLASVREGKRLLVQLPDDSAQRVEWVYRLPSP